MQTQENEKQMGHSRVLKFRAWDKELKEIREWDRINIYPFIGFENNPNYIFMQFTGLLDKNGKEIYEGDIVKNNRYGGLSEIIWEQGEGSTAGIVKGIFGEEDDLTGFISDIGGFVFKGLSGKRTKAHYIGEFEIIGNIYENPELISEDNGEQ